MKTCSRCGVEQSLDRFYKGKTYRSKDGYSYRCIKCTRSDSLKYTASKARVGTRKPYSNIIRPSIFPGAIEVKVYGKNDLWFTIDIDDFKLYSDYKFCTTVGYIAITPGSRALHLHRLIVDFEIVDHINRDKLDNRRANLRSATHGQNMVNTGPQKRNKSGYKGVYINKNKSYHVHLTSNSKSVYIGTYKTAAEAALAYDEAAKKYHGEFAYLNFPDGVSND